jgi:hypothetical protein
MVHPGIIDGIHHQRRMTAAGGQSPYSDHVDHHAAEYANTPQPLMTRETAVTHIWAGGAHHRVREASRR